ncbi:MAG: ABC transporter permease [Paracoccaceae bacterium]
MESLGVAIGLVVGFDAGLWAVIGLSLRVSITAVLVATLIGAPLGALLATRKFLGRQVLVVLSGAFMALPPVVVGLAVYLLLSRAGPLGPLGLLFTPSAMIIAQTVLILPIITALTLQAVAPIYRDYKGMFSAHNVAPMAALRIALWDARFAVATAILAGFGRAISEVGAVQIVGGNIDGVTRVMTTTIALETSKGNLEFALALGFVLIVLALLVNLAILGLGRFGRRFEEARL